MFSSAARPRALHHRVAVPLSCCNNCFAVLHSFTISLFLFGGRSWHEPFIILLYLDVTKCFFMFSVKTAWKHAPVPPGGSQVVPRPNGLYKTSSEFWVCPGVSSQRGGNLITCLNHHSRLLSIWSSSGSVTCFLG